MSKQKRLCLRVKPLRPLQCTKRRAPWWSNPNNLNIALGLLLLFVYWAVTAAFARNWFKLRDDLAAATDIYINGFRTAWTVLGFFILAYGVHLRYQQARVNADDENSSAVEELMLEQFPYSLRLYKQLYPKDAPLQRARVPKNIDKNRQKFTEILLISILMVAIDDTLVLTPLPGTGAIHTWRSWFRSRLVQRAWPANRPFFGDEMVRFVEQNLFPNSPQPQPSWFRRLLALPLVLATGVLVVFTLIGSWLYWKLWCFPPLGNMVDLYIKALEALYISALVLILVFDVITNTSAAQVESDRDNVQLVEILFLQNYPSTVRFYKQLYQNDCRLQTVKVPKNVDKNEEIMANSVFSGILVQTISRSLSLATPPAEAFVRTWRSWFRSPIMREEWELINKCLVDEEVKRFISSQLFFEEEGAVQEKRNK